MSGIPFLSKLGFCTFFPLLLYLENDKESKKYQDTKSFVQKYELCWFSNQKFVQWLGNR